MPSAAAPNPRATLPTLDDYDAAVNDFLRDLPDTGDNSINDPPAATKDDDDEIQIKRKRKPVQKLDEALLLSDRGIPKLRKITRSKLKFKGKGHEFSDIERLLGVYQLWLDDMFPRAKFKDGVTMVEKLGHRKRLQVARRGWMDETKHSTVREDEERLGDVEMSGALPNADGDGIFDSNGNVLEEERDEEQRRELDAPEGDDLDALLAEQDPPRPDPIRGNKKAGNTQQIYTGDKPEEDELDALLAENSNNTQSRVNQPSTKAKMPFEEDEDDEDELDALLAEQNAGQSSVRSSSARDEIPQQPPNEFADEEEIMAEMGW